ncbi:protoporphyrinogen oxidase HemJ [Komagataeibacter sp. FNDCR2]|uniref:protoporphyrinogen oxidase HemJ n=1 Tax=Komagataeibacter sp. FNDCR2 TaxID=2878682 RepID=UPI001E3A63D9|nr:protoporphyrinogen oxidase HemJ [Komagataeibacter sp. FNDCR2]MCE2575717.1 protoporphyrinogen oxidase HemJ [Komagataeibacter sp. FNDCR2]
MTALVPFMLWLKAFHIISLIAWMAGVFYLPRLFVYHCQVEAGSAESERFKVMEYRLLRFIMLPAMISTFIFGGALATIPGLVDWHAGWWFTKLAAVGALAGFQGACARWRRDFAHDRNTHTERFYRMANEVPTVLMMVIVIMVVVRPF